MKRGSRNYLLTLVLVATSMAVGILSGLYLIPGRISTISVDMVASKDGQNIAFLDHATNNIKVYFSVPGTRERLEFGTSPYKEELTPVRRLISLKTLSNKNSHPQVLLTLECQDGAILTQPVVGEKAGLTRKVIHRSWASP